jgi:prevent-host-death family protein
MVKVGAHEAKTHLPRLLDQVEAGESIVITRHGRDVAILSVISPAAGRPDAATAIAQWRKARKGVTLGGLKIQDLIDQGRP